MQRHVEQTAGKGIFLVQARLAKDLVHLFPAKDIEDPASVPFIDKQPLLASHVPAL